MHCSGNMLSTLKKQPFTDWAIVRNVNMLMPEPAQQT